MSITNKAKYFFKFIQLQQEGKFVGDAVIFKSAMGKFEPSENFKDFIEERKHLVPDFSDIEFHKFPRGSFGEGYYQFMKARNLSPFRFSGQHTDLMRQHYLPVFYASVHDFIHVLTGYDTSLVGEAGVWGFIAGQGISPQSLRAQWAAEWLFPLANPRRFFLIRKASGEGFLMGKRAKAVLKMNFRQEFERQLDDVRSRYDIRPTSIS